MTLETEFVWNYNGNNELFATELSSKGRGAGGGSESVKEGREGEETCIFSFFKGIITGATLRMTVDKGRHREFGIAVQVIRE